MPVFMDRRRFAFAAAWFLAAPAAARNQTALDTTSAVQRHVEGLVRDFLSRLPEDVAYDPPEVRIAFTPQLSWVSWAKPHVLHVAAWEQCPPPIRAFFASLLDGASEAEAADFYRDAFYNFLVPHEMAHFVDYQRGRGMDRAQFYQTEVRANRVAVAYWLARPEGEAWLSALMPRIRAASAKLPDPTPAGSDPAAYFNANYQALAADPSAYGWFQFRMLLEAWDRRAEADFAALVGAT